MSEEDRIRTAYEEDLDMPRPIETVVLRTTLGGLLVLPNGVARPGDETAIADQMPPELLQPIALGELILMEYVQPDEDVREEIEGHIARLEGSDGD